MKNACLAVATNIWFTIVFWFIYFIWNKIIICSIKLGPLITLSLNKEQTMKKYYQNNINIQRKLFKRKLKKFHVFMKMSEIK